MWRKTSEFAGWEARHALQLPVCRVFKSQHGCNQEGNHRGIARTDWPLCLPSCRESCSIPAANQPLSFRPVWRNLFLPDSHRHVLKPPHPSHFDEGRFSPNPERISTDEDASPENRCGGRCFVPQHDEFRRPQPGQTCQKYMPLYMVRMMPCGRCAPIVTLMVRIKERSTP